MLPELTSGALAWILIVLTVLGPIGVVVFARRTRRRGGPLRIAGHYVLVVLSQALAVMMALVLINNQFGLYATWDDLLGITPPASAATFTAPAAQPHASVKPVAWVKGLPAGFTRDTIPRSYKTTVKIAGTGQPMPMTVVLPPEYFQAKYAKTRFPVIIVLPGYPGSTWGWLHNMDLQKHAQEAVAAGGTPFIFVASQVFIAGAPDLECMDLPGQPQLETFLVKSIPQIVESHFRASTDRKGWAIGGYSEGAYCGAQLAMRHPDIFGAALSIAGYPRPESPYFKTLPQSYTDAGDLGLLLQKAPDIALLATESVQDKQSGNTFKALANPIPPTIVKTVLFQTGGHNLAAFSAELKADLLWMSQHMARV
jgi:enterochelin esterase-like enzyme